MARKLISTGSPFERDYGYSRAVVDGGVIYISGTTGYDYEKMVLPHDVGEQTRNIFRTVEKVLNEAGSSMANILRCQYFVIDHTYCEPVLKVCGEVLRDMVNRALDGWQRAVSIAAEYEVVDGDDATDDA